MREHMKKLHTKNTSENTNHIELRFIGPSTSQSKAIRYMQSIGFRNASDSVPAEEVIKTPMTPGKALRGYRYREDITQEQLAIKTGIPQRHISEMENNKRPIGKKSAKVFAEVLKADYRMFL